ncbi:hypothetical protein WR25_06912 [Diploscapter pachys]|uniref:Uncharacterized protein n=1 Tax=Diploscapter pachys TaxID=2018661 RepID=A0A2A2K7A2_9BILA|nr:hypothetical protein WR25_06912 [Diploscapter pachys]
MATPPRSTATGPPIAPPSSRPGRRRSPRCARWSRNARVRSLRNYRARSPASSVISAMRRSASSNGSTPRPPIRSACPTCYSSGRR